MKILIRNSDNIVVFAADDLFVSATHSQYSRAGKASKRLVVYKALNDKTATLVEVDSIPDDFINGMYTYIDGVWSVPDKVKFKELSDPGIDLPTQDEYITAAQEYLDNEAKSKGYDGILSACSYDSSTSPRFAAEAKACIQFRDDVWLKCYKLLADFEAGAIEQPTMKKFLKKLPSITWPQ